MPAAASCNMLLVLLQLAAATSSGSGRRSEHAGVANGLAGIGQTDELVAVATEAQRLLNIARQQSGAGAVSTALQSARAAADLLRPTVRKAGYSWAGAPATTRAAPAAAAVPPPLQQQSFGWAVGLLWVEAMVEIGAGARITEQHGEALGDSQPSNGSIWPARQ